MRYIFFGDENFHDDIAVRLANAGFERCADIEEASAIITFCTSQSALEDAYFDEGGFVQSAHPGAVVVNIACGLDTRCYRMSGYAHWYNLDLPETMAVREKLLPESGTISQITMSAMEDWGSEISEQNVPVLIVIEGLTMYLSERNIQRIFTVISSRFSNATVFVETMNPTIVRHFKEKSIDASNAKFNWGIKNGKTLAELLSDFRFVEEHSLTEGMAAFAPVYKLLDRLPAVRNISNKIIVLEKEL